MKTKLIFVAGLSCFVPALAFAASKPLATPDWTVQAAFNLSVPRAAHQATILSEGLVLVTGGCSGSGCSPVERSAELFHTTTGHTEITPPMREARVAHIAALLKDGRVLVAGGWTGTNTTASAEVFDPGTRTFTPIDEMASARMDATATPLNDGSILVAGGASAVNSALAKAEVFDLSKGHFVATGPMHQVRAHHAAARLSDGRVLVIGGLHKRQSATATAELYNPASNTFSKTGPMRHARCKHGAVLLQDGRVMVIGGSRNCEEQHRIAQTEIYDPHTGQFSDGPSLLNPRYKIVTATTVLPNGDVVVAGDANDVEIWTPGTAAFVKAGGSIGNRLAFSTATPLSDGKVLILGGYDNNIRPTAQGWLIYQSSQAGTSD